MEWATIVAILGTGTLGFFGGVGSTLLGSFMNNHMAAKREADAHARSTREQRLAVATTLFSEALAIAMELNAWAEQAEIDDVPDQELERRKLNMLARLRLLADAEIAQQWGAFVARRNATEQDKLEAMMRAYLESF